MIVFAIMSEKIPTTHTPVTVQVGVRTVRVRLRVICILKPKTVLLHRSQPKHIVHCTGKPQTEVHETWRQNEEHQSLPLLHPFTVLITHVRELQLATLHTLLQNGL